MQQVDEATETGKSSFLVAATQHANSFQVPTGAPLYPREWFAAHGKSTGNSSALMSILNASMASFSIGSSSRSIMEQADYYDTYMESENNIGSSSDTSIDTRSTKKRRKKPKRIIDESQAIEPSANDILFGRGGHTNKNPGNIRFRIMALELRPVYDACSTKEEKYKVSERFVNCMKAENRRFLERKDPNGPWYKVVGNGVRKKASQALRERIR